MEACKSNIQLCFAWREQIEAFVVYGAADIVKALDGSFYHIHFPASSGEVYVKFHDFKEKRVQSKVFKYCLYLR